MEVNQQYEAKISEALTVIEAKETTQEKQTITLSTGVVLRLKKINVLRINAINDQFKYPEVPEIYDEAKDRKLRNPDHPAYKAMCAQVDEQRTLAIIDAIAALGTEIVSVPDTVAKLEDNSWVEECQLFNIPVNPDSPLARYLAWIKFVAIGDAQDLASIASEFGMAMGTSERLVADNITANFPDQTVRTPDNGSAAA